MKKKPELPPELEEFKHRMEAALQAVVDTSAEALKECEGSETPSLFLVAWFGVEGRGMVNCMVGVPIPPPEISHQKYVEFLVHEATLVIRTSVNAAHKVRKGIGRDASNN